MNDNFRIIHQEWNNALTQEQHSQWWQLLVTGELKQSHYMGFLRETFHYTRINPQTQAYATMFFSRGEHKFIGAFLRHAMEEVGHDKLALNDIAALGANAVEIEKSKPWPMTNAFSGLPFFLIQFDNPFTYLGHIFHLEFIATQNGNSFADILAKSGIPKTALSFIEDHAHIDPKHNKMMENYIEQLVKTPRDLDAVVYGAKAACRAYSIMISEACRMGEVEFGSK